MTEKLNLESLSNDRLIEMIMGASADLLGTIKAELNRRTTKPGRVAGPIVDWNSSGGVYICHPEKCAVSKAGKPYAPSANIPVEVAKLLVESADIRKAISALLSQSQTETATKIAEKAAKKERRSLKELQAERRSLVLLVSRGRLDKSALEEFDSEHGSLDS